MALLGYKKRFIKPIISLVKEWTIRDFRKIPIKPGERLYMYTGLRTKNCKKIGEAICKWTSMITIDEDRVLIHYYGPDGISTTFGNRAKDYRSLDWFAVRDGFKDWNDLKEFWYQNHGKDCFPYTGTIIKFNKVRALPRKKVKARKPVRLKKNRSLIDVMMNAKVTKLTDGSGFFKATIPTVKKKWSIQNEASAYPKKKQ